VLFYPLSDFTLFAIFFQSQTEIITQTGREWEGAADGRNVDIPTRNPHFSPMRVESCFSDLIQ
jgi:hypothetical protein